MESLLKVKNVTKIFGKKQKQALEMVKQDQTKTDILEKTGCTVGVYDAVLRLCKVRFLSLWDYLGVESPP